MMSISATRILVGSAAILLASQTFADSPLSRSNVLNKLSPGINLGNTLEALPKETSWGNPEPTFAYFESVKKAGFKSVRIPVAWSQYAVTENRIDAKWMKHVTDVVRMAERAGLYTVINVHWDGGWIQPTYAKRKAVTEKLAKFWTQIATNFREFDNHLLFAGTNEIGVEGEYGLPTAENAEVQNGYNQTFVNTVRATGGKNKNRFLVVQAYNTNIDAAVKFNASMPTDLVKDHLIMEVHFYSPYNFTLNDKSDIWQWGSKATDSKATETWSNEAYIDAQFESMKRSFVDKGVPVILGEYCAGLKPKYPGMRSFQLDWDRFVTESAYKHGLVPMFWDTGSLFQRTTGAQKDPELVRAIMEVIK